MKISILISTVLNNENRTKSRDTMTAQRFLTISLFGIYAAGMLEGLENSLRECEGLLWLLSSCWLSMEYRERQEHLNFKAAKLPLFPPV